MKTWIAIVSAATLVGALSASAFPASAAASADLQLTATSTPQRNLLDLTVAVKNLGPSIASKVVVVEDFAGATSAVETATSHNNTTCAPTTAASGYTLAFRCTVPQLTVGATWTLTFALHAATGTSLRERATTHSAAADPVTTNNSATLSNLAGPVQDLELFGSVTGSIPGHGHTVTFTVENLGPNSVNNRITVDVASSGLEFTSESPNGQCTGSVASGTCVLDALPVGGVWSASFTCTGSASLRIKPVPGAVDPNTNNNVLVVT